MADIKFYKGTYEPARVLELCQEVGNIVFDNSTGRIYAGTTGSGASIKPKVYGSNIADVSLVEDTLTVTKIDGTTITTDLDFNDTFQRSVGLTENLDYMPRNTLLSGDDNISDALDTLAGIVDDKVIEVVAYANSLIEQGQVTPIQYVPSLLYAPSVVTDTTSTSATLNPLVGNTVYIFTQPLTQLNIVSISALYLEATIYFTTHSTTDFSLAMPQGVYKSSMLVFSKGRHYCLNVKDGVVCAEEIAKYVNESTFIYSSDQLTDGVLRSSPDIVEISGATPVVSQTKPYTIYKLGEITSLTMSQIPANTLETIVYFSAPLDQTVTLNLTGVAPLKISSGSFVTITDGSFCMAIKDGVITINKLEAIGQ